jgi:hypothetical protein
VTAEHRARRVWRAVELGLIEMMLLACVGVVFTLVAFVTRYVLGVDVT